VLDVFGVHAFDLEEAFVSREGSSSDARLREPAHNFASRFENMARISCTLPSFACGIADSLLASICVDRDMECAARRTLFAEEALHRAYSLMRLVDRRNHHREPAGHGSGTAGRDSAIAYDLAANFRCLQEGKERQIQPCWPVLRNVIDHLGALFGTNANIAVSTSIEDVSLPAYKRRALVLVAAELMTNALLHAFAGRVSGRIEIGLTSLGPALAYLRVADDGIGFAHGPPNLTCGVAAGLAGLLEADLVYDRSGGWTVAWIVFALGAG
jgi:signal transduction histidine kinase